MKIYIPENFDLKKFEEQAKPEELFKPYKTDKLAYILHLMNHIPAYDKRYLYSNRFVPLNAEILQDRISNYKDYLYLLELYGIVECDNWYKKGEKSKYYRLADEYAFGIRSYTIEDFSFKRNLENALVKLQHGSKRYQYLKKQFKGLELDVKAAEDFILEDYIIKTQCPYLRDEDNGQFKDPISQYNSAIAHIRKYEEQDFDYFTVDNKGFRFYSLLTNTRSALRNALTYNGQQLSSIDISNSQPYFSTLLFKPEFWIEGSRNNKFKPLITSILNNNSLTFSLMLQTISAMQAQPDVQSYINLVNKGEFYEYFEEKYTGKYGDGHDSRKQLKAEMFLVLFSDNRYINQQDTKGKDLFAELFPTVYKLFKLIKTKDKTMLAVLLQRIESDVILDDICEIITHGYPHVPVFTIHDSIATTTENIGLLRHIMEERLTERVGVAPKLKEETWCVENMQKELDKLKGRIVGHALPATA